MKNMQLPAIPENEKIRLESLYQTGILDTPPEERFDRLTRLARDIFGTPMALITIVDEKRQWFKSRQGVDVAETPREISFCAHTILGPDILEISDAPKDHRFAGNPLVQDSPHIRFYAGAPLTTSDGFHIGTLCIIDSNPRQLTDEEKNILRSLASLAEEEINKYALIEQKHELQQTRELNEIITRVQSGFIREPDRRRAFDNLLTDLLKLTESEYGFIGEVLLNEQGEPFLQTYSITNIAWNEQTELFYKNNAPQGLKFHNLDTLFGATLRSGEPVIANDPAHDPRRGGLPEGHPALNSFLGIPVHNDGELVAMMGIANRPGGYNKKILDFLKPLTVTIGQLVKAVRLQKEHTENRLELSRFKSTLDKTMDCVFMFDADNLDFIYVNEGAVHQVGFAAAELLQMHPYDIKPEYNEIQFRELIKPLITGEKALLNFTSVHRHKDGHDIPVDIFLQLVTHNKTGRFVAIVRDITERVEHANNLIKARDDAERANNAKTAFLSSMSHELRTPLNAILGFGQLIDCDESVTESNRDNINQILKAGNHLLNLINEILDLSKVESGHLVMLTEKFELQPVIEECIALMNALADQQGIEIKYSGDKNITVHSDRTRLKQSILNLLSNAVKYNQKNGKVEISAINHDKNIKIQVTDTGTGIPEDRMDLLFQPFYRLGVENSNIEGTGIGLALTRKIIEMMEGRIEVKSEFGRGSVFSIVIPAL